MQRRLLSERLILTPVGQSDEEFLHQLLTDSAVRQFLCDDRILTRSEVSGLVEDALAHAPRGLGLWIIATHPGERIGCAGLQPVSAAALALRPDFAGKIEPVVALFPQTWRRGLAQEALLTLVAHAVEVLNLRRLVALVDKPNLPSHRLMEGVGFCPSGVCGAGARILQCYELCAPGGSGRDSA
jgi:[ribosomal protein S5]-alanine N-acetyltransferase